MPQTQPQDEKLPSEGRSTGFQIENVNTRAEADGMDLGGVRCGGGADERERGKAQVKRSP